jgi:hypothetical protein
VYKQNEVETGNFGEKKDKKKYLACRLHVRREVKEKKVFLGGKQEQKRWLETERIVYGHK